MSRPAKIVFGMDSKVWMMLVGYCYSITVAGAQVSASQSTYILLRDESA